MKVINKSKFLPNPEMKNLITNEISTMINIDHTHCLEVTEILEDKNFIYIISPLLEDGDLVDRIKNITGNKFNESIAAEIVH